MKYSGAMKTEAMVTTELSAGKSTVPISIVMKHHLSCPGTVRNICECSILLEEIIPIRSSYMNTWEAEAAEFWKTICPDADEKGNGIQVAGVMPMQGKINT